MVSLTAAAPAGVAAGVVAGDGSSELQQQRAPEDNSTVIHENPQNASSDEELGDVRRWLENRMARAIIDCTEQVRDGSSYACQRLDRNYPDWASRYVEVRRQGGESTVGTNRTLAETRRNARTFAEQVERFRQLEAEYEEARAAGDSQRARELAHQLVRQSQEINRSGGQVVRNYDEFSNTTSSNLSVATDAVVEIENDTATTANEIREATLVGTTLTVRATKSTGSFASPIVLEGQLLTENGTAVANRQVRFGVGNGTVTTDTDDDGEFVVEYRPTTERVGSFEWTVAYRPTNTSLYGPSRDRVTTDVSRVGGTVTVTRDLASVAFGDEITVSGRVEAADRGAGGVPVAVTLGDVHLGTARTDESGYYSLTAAVPANVSTGDARLVGGLPFAGRALTAADASTSVRVVPTTTQLSLQGNRTSTRGVGLDGRLTTEDGPLVGRQVTFTVNGSTVGQVRTGPDGEFSTTVDLPASLEASDDIVVAASYAGDGNLESSRTQIRLGATASPGGIGAVISERLRVLVAQLTGTAPSDGSGLPDRLDGVLGILAVTLAAAGVVVLGVIFLRRNSLSFLGVFGGEALADDEPTETVETVTEPVDSPRTETFLLETARERFANGDTDEAVLAGYEAVRSQLSARLPRDTSMTHWELLHSYGTQVANDRADALRQLTEAYERAAFSLQTSSEETTRAALQNAALLLEESETSASQSD